MKILLFLVLTFQYVFTTELSDEFINEINTKQNLWTAGRNFPLNFPVRKLMGLKRLNQALLKDMPIVKHEINESDEIPESFDARTKWSECKSIGDVPDQSACGSGWVNIIVPFKYFL